MEEDTSTSPPEPETDGTECGLVGHLLNRRRAQTMPYPYCSSSSSLAQVQSPPNVATPDRRRRKRHKNRQFDHDAAIDSPAPHYENIFHGTGCGSTTFINPNSTLRPHPHRRRLKSLDGGTGAVPSHINVVPSGDWDAQRHDPPSFNRPAERRSSSVAFGLTGRIRHGKYAFYPILFVAVFLLVAAATDNHNGFRVLKQSTDHIIQRQHRAQMEEGRDIIDLPLVFLPGMGIRLMREDSSIRGQKQAEQIDRNNVKVLALSSASGQEVESKNARATSTGRKKRRPRLAHAIDSNAYLRGQPPRRINRKLGQTRTKKKRLPSFVLSEAEVEELRSQDISDVQRSEVGWSSMFLLVSLVGIALHASLKRILSRN